MKTNLQKHLKTLCPSISIETLWSHDTSPDMEIFRKGGALEKENKDDWQCWEASITATAIVNGELMTGGDYLGGIWEKWDINPETSNPTISGYEIQMTISALQDLTTNFKGGTYWFETLQEEIAAAVKYIESIR